MISEDKLRWLAEQSYWTDSSKEDKPYTPIEGGKYYYDSKNPEMGQFQILKIEDNTENGMQAMAVAPVDKAGNVDTSQVVIAYAGTNFSDAKDRATDLQTVAGGDKQLAVNPYLETAGQAITAQDFADSISKKYPNAIITTTGHSLGEYLALMIAAENQWRNIGFNGPDPYGILSADAKKWIKNNPGMLTNYRNRGDNAIGNLMGNGTGAEIKVSLEMGLDNPLTYHSLSVWKFDNKGNLIIPNNKYNKKAMRQQAERVLMTQFVASMYALKALEARFRSSGGGLSANEQFYLDASQANSVVETASRSLKLAMANVILLYQEAIENAEKLWNDGLTKARGSASKLSESEIEEALSTVGTTQSTVISEPCEEYREKINEAKEIGESFDTLANEIKGQIDLVVQKDQELAQQLKV